MSEEIGFRDLILYLAAVALVLFYLIYMPWVAMSSVTITVNTGILLWVYYFGLVLGLLFPLYYAIGKENMAWIVLGLSILLNSFILILQMGVWLLPGIFMLLLGLFFILPIFLEPKMADKWDMWKNIFHILKGLMIILAVAFYANWNVDAFIGTTSFNHAMPQFLFIGGGLFIAFGIILFMYGLLKLLSGMMGEKIGGYLKDLASIFYILMVITFLLGITYNVVFYAGGGDWGALIVSSSIGFFADMDIIGFTDLGAILLIILYIYGMMKIVDKNKQ